MSLEFKSMFAYHAKWIEQMAWLAQDDIRANQWRRHT
jgi:hypothetical protein